jgi:hypothetical protein
MVNGTAINYLNEVTYTRIYNFLIGNYPCTLSWPSQILKKKVDGDLRNWHCLIYFAGRRFGKKNGTFQIIMTRDLLRSFLLLKDHGNL